MLGLVYSRDGLWGGVSVLFTRMVTCNSIGIRTSTFECKQLAFSEFTAKRAKWLIGAKVAFLEGILFTRRLAPFGNRCAVMGSSVAIFLLLSALQKKKVISIDQYSSYLMGKRERVAVVYFVACMVISPCSCRNLLSGNYGIVFGPAGFYITSLLGGREIGRFPPLVERVSFPFSPPGRYLSGCRQKEMQVSFYHLSTRALFFHELPPIPIPRCRECAIRCVLFSTSRPSHSAMRSSDLYHVTAKCMIVDIFDQAAVRCIGRGALLHWWGRLFLGMGFVQVDLMLNSRFWIFRDVGFVGRISRIVDNCGDFLLVSLR